MYVPFVDLKLQYQSMKPEIELAIQGVLERTDFVLGESVREFEDAFAAYCGTDHAIGVDSGYSALELILRAYDIGPGDEVITAANTFIATVLPVSNCGAKPVLVDIDPESYNLNAELIEAAITPATRAIIAVHLYGRPADMAAITAVARRHGLVVIEDACQAHGAFYQGRRAGNLGDAAAFSFYPSKNLGAYGDGGIVVTSDAAIAKQVRLLRNIGQKVKYEHTVKGFNHRLDTLQAAILRVKLAHLDGENRWRRQAATLYNALLAKLPVQTPIETDDVEPVYHLYIIRTARREALQAHLSSAGIATGIHYPIPIHLQTAYADLGYRAGDFPVTEAYASEILSLPMYPGLTDGMVAYVAKQIEEFVVSEVPAESVISAVA